MKKNFSSRIMAAFILAAIALLAGTGCKKSDAGSGGSGAGSGVTLPKPGTYTYHTHSSDGTDMDMTNTIVNQHDSANGKVEQLISVQDTSTSISYIYANASGTTFGMNPPTSYWAALSQLQNQPGVTKFSAGGWPLLLTMKNQPSVGDAMIFSGGPVTIHVEATQDNTAIVEDFKMAYQNGNAVALNQSVVTNAGTFKCTEWAYQIETDLTGSANGQNFSQTQIIKDTVWYSPQVGMVKTREADNNNNSSETVLTKVQ